MELQQLVKRFHELAERSYSRDVFTFTGFLGLGEQDAFRREEMSLQFAGYSVYGGYENADRVMVRFGSAQKLGYEAPFPIICIHIRPLSSKFADDLTHRDFLGALMNLGIERSTLGDIRAGGRQAYLFCQESVGEFICENLHKVKHTDVKCSAAEYQDLEPEEPEIVSIQVQSLRADAVLAKVCNLSREKSLEFFRAGKVFVNGRLCENNSRTLKGGDVVNARGYGKFRLGEECRETKKGKLAVEAAVYR